MYRICEQCGHGYDDENRWTICPHGPLWAASGAYCREHDLVNCKLHEPEIKPMKYALSVEVKLVAIEEEDELPEPRPGDDPMKSAVAAMTGVFGKIGRPMMGYPVQPAGFDFRKQVTVGVANFPALAAVIGRFDELVTDIEHEKMQV